MKKILLAVVIGVGMFNFANAIDITLTSGSLTGEDAYEYLIDLAPGTQIGSASLTFNSITLTLSGAGDDMSYDLINRRDATQSISDQDHIGDYFQTHSPYSSATVGLGTENFIAPHYQWVNGHFVLVYDTESWTYNFSGATLADLQADALAGAFDIGIDPDCIYDIGSIVLTYTTVSNPHDTVPDVTKTAGLIGFSFCALLVVRRKFRTV